ncbi:rhamnulokinase [bacterium]|nr:rhamnulokinase [bacterium]
MAMSDTFLAIDLGAESGRGILGSLAGDQLLLEEVHRFPNGPVRMLNTLHWDLPQLWAQIKTAIGKAAEKSDLAGCGVDTWGVDFALVGRNDTLLGNPVHYRDQRTEGMMEAAFSRISRERIYEITGLQFMPINSVYQLLAMRLAGSPILDAAETFLMMPDVITWLMTGRRACETTDASTTQLVDPRTGQWSDEICKALDLPRHIFPEFVAPGERIGTMLKSVAEETGIGNWDVPVFAPGSHDTASAVVGVPYTGNSGPDSVPDWCYISCGTWSLLGVETQRPYISPETYACNFTNEGGVFGTTRVLKNIMGLWLVQECRRTWQRVGLNYDYAELTRLAAAAKTLRTVIDPDDLSLITPGDMPARIAALAEKAGEPVPSDPGQFIRTALDSLVLKYRWSIEKLESILGASIRTVHLVGGGIQNELLCQLTADATGRAVVAGPVEATAAGNVMVQAIASGRVSGLKEARSILAQSFAVKRYEPRPGRSEMWAEAYQRLLKQLA